MTPIEQGLDLGPIVGPFPLPADASDGLTAYYRATFHYDREARDAYNDWEAARKAFFAAQREAGALPDDHPLRTTMVTKNNFRTTVSNKFNAILDPLRKLLTEAERTLFDSKRREHFFSDETITGEPVEHLSPSGNYKLVVTRHETRPGCWNYSRGRVYRMGEDDHIAQINRNYGAFPFSWVENHGKTGGDYLIGGEDYQGQSIVDLNTGETLHSRPGAALAGFGFCWAAHTPSPDGCLIAVEGCFWAAPYEVVIFDISDPMNPPWPEVHRDDKNDHFGGWNDATSAEIGRAYDAVNVPGHRLHGKSEDEMTIEEMEEIERLAHEQGKDEEDLYAQVEDTVTWTLPDPLTIATDQIRAYYGWRKEKGYNPIPDHIRLSETLLARAATAGTPVTDPDTLALFEWAKDNQKELKR